MRAVPLVLALLSLLPAPAALAHEQGGVATTLHTTCCGPPARWAARHDPREARLAITTEDGNAILILTDQIVAVQLSDRALHRVARKLKVTIQLDGTKLADEEDADGDNALARAIKTVVISGVRALLDHSAECPVRELKDVEYRHGRLEFTTEDGERALEGMDLCDQDVMESFSARDARAFVQEFRRVKAHAR